VPLGPASAHRGLALDRAREAAAQRLRVLGLRALAAPGTVRGVFDRQTRCA